MKSNTLKTTARAKFAEWLHSVHKMTLSQQNINAYIDGIDYPNEYSAGNIEVHKFGTKSGNPEVYDFDYDDFEDCEAESE